jgi:hypothetical protein
MTIRDIERRFVEGVLGPVIMPPEKPTFSPWVFDDSGTFMVCTDGQDGGTVVTPDLFPAFDYPHENGSDHWCVRLRLLGGGCSAATACPSLKSSTVSARTC